MAKILTWRDRMFEYRDRSGRPKKQAPPARLSLNQF